MSDESPVQEPGYPWWKEAVYRVRRAFYGVVFGVLCRALGHKEDVRNSGFGFGRMDLFCARCDHLIRSVPLGELTEAQREAVADYGGFATLADFPRLVPDPPSQVAHEEVKG